jgi:hypothetical protein
MATSWTQIKLPKKKLEGLNRLLQYLATRNN